MVTICNFARAGLLVSGVDRIPLLQSRCDVRKESLDALLVVHFCSFSTWWVCSISHKLTESGDHGTNDEISEVLSE